jgi:hypothetical protein
MSDPVLIIPFAFPVFFVGIWLLVVTILSAVSGWKGLSSRFPDRDDEVLATFRMASGFMRGVRMNNILSFTVCRTGLRVAMWKLFAPFDRPFFVPWEQLGVERREAWFQKRAVLSFGTPPAGRLDIAGDLADRLSAAAQGRWPERTGTFRSAPIVS